MKDALSIENLTKRFSMISAPGTGRAAFQLTAGPATCYPLYYFIPSFTQDGRYCVYHRAADGEVQLYSLDMLSGKSTALTAADDPHCAWTPWDTDPGRGVLDHRSALNVARSEVAYFAHGEARCVQIESLEDRLLFRLPPGRIAAGQNCFSPDGRYFFYIHHDAALEEQIYGTGPPQRHLSRGTKLVRYDMDTGEQHLVVQIHSPFHHVQPDGDRHVIFSSPALELAPLRTDYEGGWFTQLRTRDDEGNTCHYVATNRGLHYELTVPVPRIVGVLCPDVPNRRREFTCPLEDGLHVGFDPEGRRYTVDGVEDGGRSLYHLTSLLENGETDWTRLTGPWVSYGQSGQKTHAHPRFTPCGRWIQMVAGDPASKTNHIFLVDARDVPYSRGLPDFSAGT